MIIYLLPLISHNSIKNLLSLHKNPHQCILYEDAKQAIASGCNQKTLFANTDSIEIHAVDTNKNLIEQVDIVVLAVKPYQIDQVITPLKEGLRDKIILPVAVNYLFEDFSEVFLPDTQHLSTLPNTPVAFGKGLLP